MFCCNTLENLVRNIGDRGFAVLVCDTDAGFRFALQMRAVTARDEATMREHKQPCPLLPEHLTLSGSMRIRYCPSCGKRLDELVASNPILFARLATEHFPYKNEWGI
jgi:hypothetical protein